MIRWFGWRGRSTQGSDHVRAMVFQVVKGEDTVFSIPEIDLGLPLAWGGIPRLVRDIGPAMTKELVMTCRRFTPDPASGTGSMNSIPTGWRPRALTSRSSRSSHPMTRRSQVSGYPS